MYLISQYLILAIASLFHLILTMREKKTMPPPGKLVDLGSHKVHLLTKGEGKITVILDHSLGGVEGYFLIDEIAKLTRVCIYDRAGYGWSEPSPKTRCSQEIVTELDLLLTKAEIEPPYILLGESFGSYNMRLYAHTFPEKVEAMILTDGLHESGMLNLPMAIAMVKYLFVSGFVMSILGSLLGLIRIMGMTGLFEIIKPQLRQFNLLQRQRVKRSFYRHNHWLTMARELINFSRSSRQVMIANDFANLPIISIRAKTFFHPSIFTIFLPLKTFNRLRDKMHHNLSLISTQYTEIIATKSSHFVWIDEPEIVIQAIAKLLR